MLRLAVRSAGWGEELGEIGKGINFYVRLYAFRRKQQLAGHNATGLR